MKGANPAVDRVRSMWVLAMEVTKVASLPTFARSKSFTKIKSSMSFPRWLLYSLPQRVECVLESPERRIWR